MEMRAETAAAFCDEPSVAAFVRKVARGQYSQPVKVPGAHPKWHRWQLENDIAKRHGFDAVRQVPPEDIRGLI